MLENKIFTDDFIDSDSITLVNIEDGEKKEVKLYSYLFIREDLSPAQQIIQASHAMSQMSFKEADNATQYLNNTPNIVLVGCANLDELQDIELNLMKNQIKFEAFYEPDIGNQMTAIATSPISRKPSYLKKQQLKR